MLSHAAGCGKQGLNIGRERPQRVGSGEESRLRDQDAAAGLRRALRDQHATSPGAGRRLLLRVGEAMGMEDQPDRSGLSGTKKPQLAVAMSSRLVPSTVIPWRAPSEAESQKRLSEAEGPTPLLPHRRRIRRWAGARGSRRAHRPGYRGRGVHEHIGRNEGEKGPLGALSGGGQDRQLQ